MASQEGPPHHAASLKGKTVGLPNGEQQLLQAMFKRAGVDPNDVTLVVVGTDPSVLTSGSVDAYIGYGTEQGLDMQQAGYDVNHRLFRQARRPRLRQRLFRQIGLPRRQRRSGRAG